MTTENTQQLGGPRPTAQALLQRVQDPTPLLFLQLMLTRVMASPGVKSETVRTLYPWWRSVRPIVAADRDPRAAALRPAGRSITRNAVGPGP